MTAPNPSPSPWESSADAELDPSPVGKAGPQIGDMELMNELFTRLPDLHRICRRAGDWLRTAKIERSQRDSAVRCIITLEIETGPHATPYASGPFIGQIFQDEAYSATYLDQSDF